MSDTFTRDRWSWLDQVSSDPALSALAFRTAYVIARYTNRQTGDAWPSLETLAKAVGATDRSVKRCIAELCDAGYLQKRRGGFGKSNRYQMELPGDRSGNSIQDTRVPNEAASEDTSVPNDASIQDTSVPSFRTPVSPQLGHQCPTNPIIEPVEIEPVEKDISPHTPRGSFQQGTRQEDHSRAFDEFWLAYPLRKAKGAARRAFDKAIKGGASAAAIIEGAKLYASERAGQETRYTAHPATWLTGERWTDERKPAQGVTIDHQGNVIDAARTFDRPKARSKADEHEAVAYGAFGLRGRS
ncbi:MAG: helix-turn-helix domain-containing protein [Aestuariivirga sp.]|nr:helix-turn-helix domain-containing protein [Aestuariivirga sp.]